MPFYPCFPEEPLHTKGHTAIGCGCALDLIENVPFVHDTRICAASMSASSRRAPVERGRIDRQAVSREMVAGLTL